MNQSDGSMWSSGRKSFRRRFENYEQMGDSSYLEHKLDIPGSL